MGKERSNFNGRLVILGFDGLSPEIVKSMMEEGRLPNFSKLKKEGSSKRLLTTNPSQSPVAWAGFATGKNPGKNGIYDFIVRDPATYRIGFSFSDIEGSKPRKVLKSRSFWQYASEKKVHNAIIACPVTSPPDRICGRMLSGMGVPDILGTEGTFTFYTTETTGKTKDIRGNVFKIRKSPIMVLHLIGPRSAEPGGRPDNIKIPFKVVLQEDKGSAVIEYGDQSFELKTGEWSDWKTAAFKLGLFKKVKGILKFYLAETSPEFKLYISPINFDPRSPSFHISYPKSYSKLLARNIGLYYTQGMPVDTLAVNEKRLTEAPFLKQVNEVLDSRKAMFDFELDRLKKGILFCYFGSPDVIQHIFWRYTDREHPLYEKDAPQEYRGMIKEWYRKMDDILGDAMRRIDRKDTIFVLSDHGFGTFRRAAHINSWLRKNGYLELKDRRLESGAELLRDIDWANTRAYAVGFGAIYINQSGRERSGIVKPGKETEILKEELSEKLKDWHDEKYDKAIINRVYTAKEIFRGECADNAPDLYAGFNIGYRASWQTALGGAPKELIEDNLKKWSGSHLFDPDLIPGVLFCNRRIIKENPSIYDMAPTILSIIGFGRDRLKKMDFDGEPLFRS